MKTPQEVRNRIKGPIPGLPALFTDDFRVNHAGMREHVNFLIDHGIKVLMLSVGITEYQHLSEEEIKAIAKTVVEAADGRAVVIAEAGAWWTSKAVEFARYVEGIGADALLVIPPDTSYLPYAPDVHDDDLYRHYEVIASATNLGVLFHLKNLRGRGASSIWSMSLIERVATIDNVIGLKDESTNWILSFNLMRKFGSEVVLIDDAGPLSFYHNHRAGSPAWITGIGQFAPHLTMKFYNDLQNGRLDEAQRYGVEVAAPYFTLMLKFNWVAVIKAAMDIVGLQGGLMRPPTPPLTPEQRSELKAFMEEHGMMP